ncbi:translation initiation factor IF-6 [Candidatus Woesearchaeota archaeon]|nr:translation initiation factor IF-6 [Candidatus Woesearchaeota archaeon]
MHVTKLSVQGNSLVGLYIVPMDGVVLVGHEVPESADKHIAEIFGVEVVRMTVAGTSLLGVFLATDGEKLLVPHIIFPHEEELLKQHAIPYMIVPSDITCLGNNIIMTKKGILASPEYDKEALDAVEGFFEREVRVLELAGIPTVGALIAHNDTHGMVSHEIAEETINELASFLGLVITTGTVNMGSTQIRSGIAVNNKGFIIGDASGGPELMNADQALGFIDG